MSGVAVDRAELVAAVHQDVLQRSDGAVPDRRWIEERVRAADPVLGPDAVAAVAGAVQARVVGLGPLAPLLDDPAVAEVMVNGPGRPVWIERAGRLEATSVVLDRSAVDLVVERIVAPLGLRVDPAVPVADARLADGSRVNVVAPPLAIDGPYVTIRRFGARAWSLDDLAAPPVAALLRWAVRSRANVVVSGGTGSGKTTLLNALAAELPAGERVVTVEDAAELRLPGDHVLRLEARPGTVEGTAPVTIRDLVRNALRMRPDRLLVGEVRGAEALDMLQAMNTGHDGSLSTCHANHPDDALRRLETMVLLAEVGLSLDAVRDHLASAVDLVVQVARQADGARRVVAVAEVAAGGGPGPRCVPLADGARLLRIPARTVRDPSAPAPPRPEAG